MLGAAGLSGPEREGGGSEPDEAVRALLVNEVAGRSAARPNRGVRPAHAEAAPQRQGLWSAALYVQIEGAGAVAPRGPRAAEAAQDGQVQVGKRATLRSHVTPRRQPGTRAADQNDRHTDV